MAEGACRPDLAEFGPAEERAGSRETDEGTTARCLQGPGIIYLTVNLGLQSRAEWQVTFRRGGSISQETPFLLPQPALE